MLIMINIFNFNIYKLNKYSNNVSLCKWLLINNQVNFYKLIIYDLNYFNSIKNLYLKHIYLGTSIYIILNILYTHRYRFFVWLWYIIFLILIIYHYSLYFYNTCIVKTFKKSNVFFCQ